MAEHCCAATPKPDKANNDPRWRRILWIALVSNLVMFFVEMAAGALGGSRALQADALDFLGDAANYAISLSVAGMALAWRARTALVKGITIFAFGWAVLAAALWGMVNGSAPDPWAMTGIGALALTVNLAVALMLFRYRTGDANMRSVWICSRNDAINNLLVIGAGLIVLWTGSGWPDLIVALVMAGLGISGGWQVIRQARGELSDSQRKLADNAFDHIRRLYKIEIAAYRAARALDDDAAAWRALERAHIIAQPNWSLHLDSHMKMLAFAIWRRDPAEVAGQLLRLVLAPIGNLTGRLPIGNTGRANVSAFKAMDLPEDLNAVLIKR